MEEKGEETEHLEKLREKNSRRKRGGTEYCWECLFLNERKVLGPRVA